MIHPSMQAGFHPNAAFWVVLVLIVVAAFASRRKRGSQ